MEQQSSHRRAVAAALATLIRQRLGAARTSTILRTALHSSVPVSERPDVRRGVDGLVANGVLAQTGEYIGFTAKGRLYLAHLRGAQLDRRASPRHDMDEADAAAIVNLLRKIDEDEHFEPYGKAEAVESLPARLEAQMAARRPQPGKIKWILLAFLLVLVVALFALRH